MASTALVDGAKFLTLVLSKLVEDVSRIRCANSVISIFTTYYQATDLKDKWRNLQRLEERAALTLGVDTTPKVPRKRKRSVLEQQDNSASGRLFSDDDIEDSGQDDGDLVRKKQKVSED